MTQHTYWWLMATLAVGFVVLGQNQTTTGEAAQSLPSAVQGSRDNFGPEGNLQPRLSREELEQATQMDQAQEAPLTVPARPPASPPSRVPSLLGAHRFSRDSALVRPAAHLGRAAAPDWQITVKNTFIEKYKNRAQISTPFQSLFFKLHSVDEDGDEHVAGLTDEVGLACVAEVMNIKDRADAQAVVQHLKSTGEITPMTGVWRLWCEHPNQHPETAGPQIQDDVIPAYPDSNPNHVFEIHPVSRFGTLLLLDTFHPIPAAYQKKKEAKKAFKYYDSLTCRIVPDHANQTTTLFTPQAAYNYTEFKLRIEDEEQFITLDGRIVRCSALNLSGEVVAKSRRMIFVRDTPPEKAVRNLKKGAEMHVLGIPRIDLALVSYRNRVADSHPEVLTWNLPYEMIVVGLYEN